MATVAGLLSKDTVLSYKDSSGSKPVAAVKSIPAMGSDPEKVDVSFASETGTILVCKAGSPVNFDEKKAKEILLQNEVKILVNMNLGSSEVTTWGCDLTYDYVKINGDYRS